MNNHSSNAGTLAAKNIRFNRNPFMNRSKEDTVVDNIPIELRIATYIFIFSTPWQAIGIERDIFAELSVSKLAGGIFFLMFVFYGKFRINNIKTGQSLILIYLGFAIAHSGFLYYSGIAKDSYWEISAIYTLGQLIVLYLVLSVVLQDKRTVSGSIYAMIISYVSVVAISWKEVFEFRISSEDRLMLFGENSNNLGVSLAIIINTLLSLILSNKIKTRNLKLISAFSIVILAIALMATGSRGAILTLIIGIVLNAILYLRRGSVLLYSFYFTAIVLILYYVIIGSELMLTRINQSTVGGDTGFRIELLISGFDLFKDQPLFGWGTGYMARLARVSGYRGDIISAHNTFLQVLLEHGLIGFVIFIMGISFSIYASLKWRRDGLKYTPFILLMSILAGGITKGWAYNKMSWVVFAIANSYVIVKSSRRNTPKHIVRKL